MRYRVGTGSGDDGIRNYDSKVSVNLNKIYEYTSKMEYNKEKNETTVKLYLNGVLGDEYSFTGKPLVTDDPTYHTLLGKYSLTDNGLQYLDGTIHSVKIYDRALSDEEIEYNYKIDKQRFNIEE